MRSFPIPFRRNTAMKGRNIARIIITRPTFFLAIVKSLLIILDNWKPESNNKIIMTELVKKIYSF